MEKIRSEQPEKIKKYTLLEANIIPLDENSAARERWKEFFKSLKEEGVDWPVEIQGCAHSDFEKKEFKVYYPVGDIFMSFAVIMHELGHLRQGEAVKRFAIKTLGAPKSDPVVEENNDNSETEKDAWERGFNRSKKYCPEVIFELESKFKQYKQDGKFAEFSNFSNFFDYIVRVFLKITDIHTKLGVNVENLVKECAGLIKEDLVTKDFFVKQDIWRTGEIIDRKEAEEFIKKAAAAIAEEIY